MLTFKQFLNEVARSPERASKLVDNLAKRYAGSAAAKSRPGVIPIKNHQEYPWDHYPTKSRKKTIDIKDVVATQGSVDSQILKNKINNSGMAKDKGEESHASDRIDVLHHKGKYFVTNGHHRLMRAKILGHKHISAEVEE